MLSDVTIGYDAEYGITSWNGGSNTLYAGLTLTNNGRLTVRGDTAPLLVGVTNVSHPLVRLRNADGITPEGVTYYDVSRLAFSSDELLAENGHVIDGIELEFINPSRAQFSYDLVVLGGLNRAPVFTSTAVTEVNLAAGSTDYQYQSAADDPDNPDLADLEYELVAGPGWLAIDEGLLSGTPPATVENYDVVIRVTDPFAAYDEQSFTIQVIDVPNRPPRFRTDPVVEAYAGEVYSYPSLAIDPDNEDLAYSVDLYPNPPGDFHIDPNTGEVTWTPPESLIGETVPVTIRAQDAGDLFATQPYSIYVHPNPANRPPVIVSDPARSHYLPIAPVELPDPVDPRSLAFSLADGQSRDFNVSLNVGAATSRADIVFMVDESSSMEFAHDWLASIIDEFDAGLVQQGFTDVHYGLVGFGKSDPWPYSFIIDVALPGNESLFGDADQLVVAMGSLSANSGRYEDGYEAIDFVLTDYEFRTDAVVALVLVTDEDRDALALNGDGSPKIGYSDVITSLARNASTVTDDITLNVVISGELHADDTVMSGQLSEFIIGAGTSAVEPLALTLEPEQSGGMTLAYHDKSADPIRRVIETVVTIEDDGVGKANAFVVLDYQSDTNFKFAGVDIDSDEWVFGYVDGNGWNSSYSGALSTTLAAGQMIDLAVEVDVTAGGDVSVARVRVNRVVEGEYEFSDEIGGQFGLATDDSKATFANFRYGAISVNFPEALLPNYSTSFGGTRALGIGPDHTGYLPDANGSYVEGINGQYFQVVRGYDFKTYNDYVRLAWQTGGSVWDLSQLREVPLGDPLLDSFSAAFVDVLTQDLQYPLSVELELNEDEGDLGFSYTDDPIANDGNYVATFTGDGRTHDFRLQFVNEGTVLGEIPVAINVAYTYDLAAVDPDDDTPLTFSWTPNTPTHGAELQGDQVVWNPDTPGFYRFSVTVTDHHGGFDVQEWTVEVLEESASNNPPTIVEEPTAGGQIRRDWQYEVNATDPDGDTLRYYLIDHPTTEESPPEFMTIDRNTGVVRWTPSLGEVGPFRFGVLAVDGRGGEATAGFEGNVTSIPLPNSDPRFDSIPVETAIVGESYTYNAHATDADGDALAYSLAVGPSTMVVDPETGVVRWNPVITDLHAHDVVIMVSDGRGGVRTQGYRIDVGVLNESPEIISTPNGPIGLGGEWEYELEAHDPNGDEVEYRLVTAPAGMAIVEVEGKHYLQWMPAVEGEFRVEVVADDGRGGLGFQTFVLGVTINTPPVFTSVPSVITFLGSEYSYPLAWDDPDVGDEITVSLSRDSEDRGMYLDDDILRWTPTIAGIYDVAIRVVDQSGHGEWQEYPLLVVDGSAVNEPPNITSIPLGPAVADSPYVYHVEAWDPNGDTITFDLDQASKDRGMQIDPNSGMLTWTPTLGGSYYVEITASDGLLSDVQTFHLPVNDNAPPEFDSQPVHRFDITGGTYTYDADATDPNPEDTVTYYLDSESEARGMAIDTDGVVTWVPANPDDLGTVWVTVTAKDDSGASATQTYDLLVYDGTSNGAPMINATSDATIQAGQLYEYQVKATDPEGDPLTYELVGDSNTPSDLTMDDHGLVRWSTTVYDVNLDPSATPHLFGVRVHDDHDNMSELKVFSITVIAGPPRNTPPHITSLPLGSVALGSRYEYQATAVDDESDDFSWTLDAGPHGMSINRATGFLTWTPNSAQLGTHEVIVRVTDASGAAEQQIFDVIARSVNLPPSIDTDPTTLALVGEQYTYDIKASDPDNPLAKLVIDLVGTPPDDGSGNVMTIEQIAPGEARLTWTPSASALGPNNPYRVTVQVSDNAGGFAFQEYDLTATDDATETNLAPLITSDPVYLATIGEDYEYIVEANDPDSGPGSLHYSLSSPPTGMIIDSISGVISWPAADVTAAGVGPHPVSVVVRDDDGNGLGMVQTFTLTVRANGAPSITSPPVTTINAGKLYKYDVIASDPDGDPLEYELTLTNGTPTNALTIDEFGRIRWQTTTDDAGNTINFDVGVNDSYAASSTPQQIQIIPASDDVAPVVAVYASHSQIHLDGVVTFFVSVVDDVDGRNVDNVQLYVDNVPNPIPVGRDGLVTVAMDTAGTINFHATAEDLTGNMGTSPTDSLYVYTPVDPNNLPPVVKLTAPASDFDITQTVEIFGIVDDPEDDAVTYSLSLVPTGAGGQPARIDLGSFAGQRGDATLQTSAALGAQIDPSSLPNGSYWLELVATDGKSPPQVSSQLITIDSQFKLGNFALSFTDLQSSVAGLPLTIRRTYDTLQANRIGDFGYGWSLDMISGSLDIQLSDNPNNSYWAGFGIDPALFNGSRMVVTLPDGQQIGFTAVPMPTDTGEAGGAGAILGLADIFALGFLPDEGNLARLDLAGTATDYFYPRQYINRFDPNLFSEAYKSFAVVLDPETGEFREVTTGAQSTLGIPKNPSTTNNNYRLTMPDRSRYIFDSKTGELLSYTDPQGNRLVFNRDNVFSVNSSGEVIDSVEMHRDSSNRVIEVVDVDGQSIRYEYDPVTGDLLAVTNRATETTRFEYDVAATNRPHYLTGIVDSRGVRVLAASFDPGTGRLLGLQDAAGNPAGFSYSLDLGDGRSVEQVSDADGSPTEIVRDARGNVERSIQRVEYTADAGTNRYLVTVFRYDANDNQTHVSVPVEAIGDVDRFTVGLDFIGDPNNLDFDPSVWETISVYDQDDNLLSSTDALGHATYYGNFDKYGNPATITDALGRVTTNTFSEGFLTATKDPADGITQFEYNIDGGLWKTHRVAPSGALITNEFIHDEKGRLLSSIDPSGVSRHFRYDARGNQVVSFFEWDDPSPAAGGDGTSGNGTIDTTLLTRSDYDQEDRVTQVRQYTLTGTWDGTLSTLDQTTPDWTTQTFYNAAGQVVEQVDQFGRHTYTLFDVRGNAIETRTETENSAGQPRWLVTRTFYDANGRVAASMDPIIVANGLAPTDSGFTIDDDSQDTPLADRRVTRTIYDPAGRAVETQRLAGVEIALDEDSTVPNATVPIYETIFVAPTGAALAAAIRSRSETRFDAAGRVAQSITYDTTDLTDPLNEVLNRTWFEYDAAGRQSAVVQAVDLNNDDTLDVTYTNGVPDGGPELIRTTSRYDAAGQLVAQTDALGNTTLFEYDAAGRQSAVVLPKVLDPASGDVIHEHLRSETAYDVLGRRVSQIENLTQSDPNDPTTIDTSAARQTDFGYNDAGQLTGVTLPEITDGTTGSITGTAVYAYLYDVYGNQTLIRDPMDDNHSGTLNKETVFTYDAAGRQLSRTLPDDSSERFEYDEHGRQTLHVDFRDRHTKFVYDLQTNRLDSRVFYADAAAYAANTPSQTISYTYDALDRVITLADDLVSEATETRKYDADGRLVQIQSDQGYLNYAYDALGQLTRTWSSKGPSGALLADAITDTGYTYDALGRLESVSVVERNDAGPLAVPEVTEYRYDANGNLDVEIRHVDATTDYVTDYVHDELNRLTELRHFDDDNDAVYEPGVDTLLAEYLYTLRADGLRVRADETDANGDTSFDWVYDELGRLTEETYDGPGTADGYVARYGFDLASNRVHKEVDLGNDATVDEIITYFHDVNDRLTREERDDQTPAAADTTTFYAYYATEQTSKKQYGGLHTSEPTGDPDSTTTYEYNLQGRLEKVTVDDGTSVTVTDYLYNDAGARIQKTVQVDGGVAVVTEYHIDPQNHTGYAKAIEEIVDGQLERSYAIGHAIISQALADGTLFQLLHDGHGSTRALLNPVSGQIVERYAYDAYGETLAGTGLTSAALAQTTWLFAGDGQFDPASGLTNHIARWRSGGLFLTLDPFQGNPQDPLSLHKYLYTHGNPVVGTDPTGESLLAEINISAAIQFSLATVNFVSLVHSTYSAIQHGANAFHAFQNGEFWDGLVQVAAAALNGGSAALSAIGLRASLTPPPSLGGFGAVAVAGAGTASAALWKIWVVNPAAAKWMVQTVGPVVFKGYLLMASSKEGIQNHHKVPYGNSKYDFQNHQLVRRAGVNLEKDSRNQMLLGNHAGRHSTTYLDDIQLRLDRAWKALKDRLGGRVSKKAADDKFKAVVNTIERDIGKGTLKPYNTKEVWVVK